MARASVPRPPRAGAVPALAGPLHLEVECLTSRTARRGARHAVTLHPDGTLETPHDLAAERVAVAFGGYCSCLELADAAPGILTAAVGLLTRRARPVLRRRPDGRWALPRASGCDCTTAFRTAVDAASHARGPRHLASRHRVPERVVRVLVEGLERVLPAPAASGAAVREPAGAERLWAAGLHPDDVAAWADLAAAVPEPLPVAYFLGMAYGSPDPAFVAAALPARPDGDTAAWLAWLPPDLRRGPECRVLLAAGLPREDVLSLLAQDVRVEDLERLGAASGLPTRVAVRRFAAWARAGCRPDASHLRALAAHGLVEHRPSAAVLDRLEAVVAGWAAPPSRTELGVLAALLGGRAGVLRALEAGVRSVAELVASEPEGQVESTGWRNGGQDPDGVRARPAGGGDLHQRAHPRAAVGQPG